MDKKLKAKWLKALRSGRYKQGTKTLKADGSYCCLGVLAALQGAKFKDGVPFIGKEQISPECEEVSFLRPKFSGGLRKKTQKRLAEMNDGPPIPNTTSRPSSFKEIADYIEKRL